MITLQIKKTKNYAMFKPHGEQQPMQPLHLKKMAISMNENGFIQAKPIHCYRDGKFLRVIDGHHRLRCAQMLGIEVYYVIGDKSEKDLIAAENFAVRTWNLDAFINMYASRGLKDYIKLIPYTKKGIPLTQVVYLLSGRNPKGSGGGNVDDVKNGAFKIRNTSSLDEIIRIMDEVKKVNKEGGSRSFIAAISILIDVPDFSADHLISKINMNPRMLVKCADRLQMLDLIEEIYNFRSRDKFNLAFQAIEKSRNKKELVAN